MLLLIDIGNTSTTIGFYSGGVISDILRLSTIRRRPGIREYSYILKGVLDEHDMGAPSAAVICSVVPEAAEMFTAAVKKTFGIDPLHVSHEMKTGLKFRIKDPGGLGADRIANAAAARHLYKGPLIIVDFGTATTFCVVSEKAEYRGGAIMPGIAMALDSLKAGAAKLPKVDLERAVRVLGRDTKENILAGVTFGHAGAVERIIFDITKETGGKPAVVATGGLLDMVAPHLKMIDYSNPLLTLEGLRLLYELNTGKD